MFATWLLALSTFWHMHVSIFLLLAWRIAWGFWFHHIVVPAKSDSELGCSDSVWCHIRLWSPIPTNWIKVYKIWKRKFYLVGISLEKLCASKFWINPRTRVLFMGPLKYAQGPLIGGRGTGVTDGWILWTSINFMLLFVTENNKGLEPLSVYIILLLTGNLTWPIIIYLIRSNILAMILFTENNNGLEPTKISFNYLDPL